MDNIGKFFTDIWNGINYGLGKTADILMGGMTLINIPCCAALSGIAIKALRDYEKQKKHKLNPVFKAEDIGLDSEKLSFWK